MLGAFSREEGTKVRQAVSVLAMAVGAPMVLASLVLAAGPGILTALAAFLLGWWGWLLFEYWFHRWMEGKGREDALRRAHRIHHAHPDQLQLRDGLVFNGVFLVLAAVVGGLGTLLVAWWVLPLALGFACGGGAYSLVHWRCHNDPARSRWRFEQRLRESHLHHHFVDARTNFGFSTLLWDHVWRTWTPPRPLPVKNPRLPAWVRSGATAERHA